MQRKLRTLISNKSRNCTLHLKHLQKTPIERLHHCKNAQTALTWSLVPLVPLANGRSQVISVKGTSTTQYQRSRDK